MIDIFTPSAVRFWYNLDIAVIEPGTRRLLERQRIKNKFTSVGLNAVADLFLRGVESTGMGFAPNWFALGTGTTPPVAGDSALETEVARWKVTARKKATAKATFQLFLDTDDGNGVSYTEAGLFDTEQVDQGIMMTRATFTALEKTVSIQAVFTWDYFIVASA